MNGVGVALNVINLYSTSMSFVTFCTNKLCIQRSALVLGRVLFIFSGNISLIC